MSEGMWNVGYLRELFGLIIKNAVFDEENNKILLHFDCGILQISDKQQGYCDDRYITMDDNINDLIGGSFKHLVVKSVTEETDADGSHEIQFVEIATNKDSIVFCTHNEHSGYYCGFELAAEIIREVKIND